MARSRYDFPVPAPPVIKTFLPLFTAFSAFCWSVLRFNAVVCMFKTTCPVQRKVLLEAVVSNLPFASTEREIQPCMNCGRCQTACPGNALSETHFQREACFSEITQKKKAPTEAQIHIIQKHRLVWGCDICQDVCPMNRGKLPTSNPLFLQDIICELTEEVILNCYRERAFGFRGAKVPLRNLKLIEQK